MLSRVANSVFWMSRYIERAENVARAIDVNLDLTLDLEGSVEHQWEPLITTSGNRDAFLQRFGVATQANVIKFMAFDKGNANSILSCVSAARENARSVRAMISSEMWEEVNKFYLRVREAAAHGWRPDEAHQGFFGEIRRASELLAGVTDASMSHGEAWHFYRLGKLLERADQTSRILDVKYFLLLPSPEDVGTPLDTSQWAALLKSASALEMYRKVHGRITPSQVADFLILDRHFPRAIHFCLIKAEESLYAITGAAPGTFRNKAEKLLGRLRAELDYTQIHDIIGQGLHEYLDQFQRKLNVVGDAILETFFALRPLAVGTTKVGVLQ